MKRVGILSDTHNYISHQIVDFFSDCYEIWHAGDIGSIEITEELKKIKPLKAVWGNIDGQDIRIEYPEMLRLKIENTDVVIKHIVGYPSKYDKSIIKLLQTNPPDLLIAGHSHILRVMYDKKYNFLFINPGAFGLSGFHIVRTAVKLDIENKNFSNLKILELNKS